MTRAEAMLYRLVNGIQTSASAVVVVAHPDDEALSLGGSLGLMPHARILQLTDGAPRDPAHRLAPHRDDIDQYRAMRRRERDAAYQATGWAMPVVECGVPDQDAHAYLPVLLDRLLTLLAGVRVVFTHPYEGGHPDHDAAAFLVQTACDRIAAQAPERIEFASYHWDGQRQARGVFWRDPSVREWAVKLAGPRLATKRAALAAYGSQAKFLGKFPIGTERFRVAPRYDFTQPPPTPRCVYEHKGWTLTNAALRAAMAKTA